MRRREFIKTVGGVLTAWPLVAHAQQPERMRRLGVLSSLAETDTEAQAWDAAFRKRLVELGWIDGRSVHIDYRWAAGSLDRMRLFAKELVQLNPDALVTISTPATAALQAETRTIPIVFAWVSDPVGSGFVSSLAHPGGNITGFLNIEASVVGKWLSLMREIAPQVSRIGFLYNPQTAPYAHYYLDTFRTASSTLAIEAIDAPVRSTEEVEAFQFGAMFFPDRTSGYREARRVLKPGGHFLFNVWDRIEENVFADDVTKALADIFPNDPPRFLARTPHGYHDTALIRSELEEAGFSRVIIETRAEQSRASSPRLPAVAYCQGTLLHNEIEAREAGKLEEATDYVASAIADKHGCGEVAAKTQAHVIVAIV